MPHEDWKTENRMQDQPGPQFPASEQGPQQKSGLLSKHLTRGHGLIQKYLIAPMSMSNNPPWFDARGVAIGLFVALGIPIGGHTMALGFLLLLVRYNFPIAFAVTWIVNPITVIPLYYGYYYVGSVLLGDSAVMGIDGFRRVMAPVLNAGHFLEALKLFICLDFRILERWILTATLVSTASAGLGYLVTCVIQQKRKDKMLAKSIGLNDG